MPSVDKDGSYLKVSQSLAQQEEEMNSLPPFGRESSFALFPLTRRDGEAQPFYSMPKFKETEPAAQAGFGTGKRGALGRPTAITFSKFGRSVCS